MKNFNWGGREMPFGQGYACLIKQNNRLRNRLLLSLGRYCSDVILTIFCVLFSGLLVSSAFGQEANGLGKIKPLQIGDTIPEELWNLPLQVVNHPDGRDTITLNDYRSKKLIILDFWATWCGSCLDNMINIKGLESSYKTDVSFLKVNSLNTKDTPGKIEKAFAKLKSITNESLFDMEYIAKDVYLSQYFKHLSIPHIVWIYNGKYIGSTAANYLNQKVINELLESGSFDVNLKSDILSFEPDKPISSQVKIDYNATPTIELLFTGYIEGLDPNTGTFYKYKRGNLFRIVNYDLKYLFVNTFREVFLDVPTWAIKIDDSIASDIRVALISPNLYKDVFSFEVQSSTLLTENDVLNLLRSCLVSKFKIMPVRTNEPMVYWTMEVFDKRKFNETVRFFDDDGVKQLITYNELKRRIESFQYPVVDLTNIKSGLFQIQIPPDLDWSEEEEVQALLNKKGVKLVKVEKDTPTVTFKKI